MLMIPVVVVGFVRVFTVLMIPVVVARGCLAHDSGDGGCLIGRRGWTDGRVIGWAE